MSRFLRVSSSALLLCWIVAAQGSQDAIPNTLVDSGISTTHVGVALLDWLTLAIAAGALTLGIVNSIHGHLRNRVRIRVVPKTAVMGQGALISQSEGELTDFNTVVVEITNLSEFPVFLGHVGFNIAGTTRRSVMFAPFTTNKGTAWPIKLDPRESTTVLGESGEVLATLRSCRVTAAYVETDCGVVVAGTSRPFKEACTMLYEE